MEHLAYNPSPRRYRHEVRAAMSGSYEVRDWGLYEMHHGALTPLKHRTHWLGHEHTASSHYHQTPDLPQPPQSTFRDLYGPDWNIEEMTEKRDMRAAHPALRTLQVSEATHQTAAFIQSWLYFGLLESIIARPIHISYLTRTDADGDTHLYSRTLPIILDAWIKGLYSVEVHFRVQTLQAARECSLLANTLLSHIISAVSAQKDYRPFGELAELLLAMEPALSALHEAIARLAETYLGLEIASSNASNLLFTKPYRENLIQKGWCRFVVASAEIALSPSFLKYIDVVDLKATNGGHELCISDECKRKHVQVDTYVPQHRMPTCQCRYIKPDCEKVLEILNQGLIPVVRMSKDQESLGIAGVSEENKRVPYIAFSHVWADGLGSSSEVGLPLCQVHRLQKLANDKEQKGTYFWIDGLCIPEKQPHRKKAIRLMKKTYENASKVVILDNGLCELSVECSALELGWSVFASGWFGRLWTFQEGFLPSRVQIELRDGLLDLDTLVGDLYRMCMNRSANPFPAVFVRDLVAILQKIRPIGPRNLERPWSRRLVDLFNALSRRRTSRPDDQLLVIGIFLELELEKFMSREGNERWQAFYLALGTIPWTVVFDQRPKLEEVSFTWAPSTWISTGRDEWLHYDDEMGRITHQGLKVTLTVLMFGHIVSTSLARIIVQVDDIFYEVYCSVQHQTAKLESFNVVIVRYYKGEAPYESLRGNRSVLLRVGLGLKIGTKNSPLGHDFGQEWDIREIAEADVTDEERQSSISGSWVSMKCCFM
ncbi:het protein [Paramyrothecium foliicola]|nr:het protein [Paramyrothecium foliicola]